MRRLALAALLLTSSAEAKLIQEQPEPENAPIAVRGALEGTTAHFVATYRIATDDPTESTHAELALPNGGVVIGATISHGGVSHRMTLDTTETVETRFGAAFESGSTAKPTMWVAKIDANAYSVHGYGVTISIGAPVSAELVVELEISAPTCFVRDVRHVRVPDSWVKAARAKSSAELEELCGARTHLKNASAE